MKALLVFSLIFVPLISFATEDANAPASFLRTFSLSERTPYQIPVAVDRGVTTLVFPEPPQNYAASRVAFIEAGQSVPDLGSDDHVDFIVLTHRDSTNCSIRALRADAHDTLTVFLNGKVYQLFLSAAQGQPLLTVEFHYPPNLGNNLPIAVSPNRLIDCLTRAKAYPILAKNYPDQFDDVTHVVSNRVIEYPDFRVQTFEVFRFDAEDTLVFHLLLENESPRDIPYQASQISIRVEPQTSNLRGAPPIYSASIVDASGVMPAHSVTTAWVAITGTRDGGRNELDPARNIFTVLVPRTVYPRHAAASAQVIDPKNDLNQ